MATPRVTSTDSSKGQPGAAGGPVNPDRLGGVSRTRGLKPTRRRDPRRNRRLVEADQTNQDSSEQNASTASFTSRASSSKVAAYALRLARIRTSPSQLFSSMCGRTDRRPISLSRLLSRFRSTIRRPCLGTITPSREKEAGEDMKKTSTLVVLFRFPRSNSARISVLRRIRALRGRPSPCFCVVVTSRRSSPPTGRDRVGVGD